MYNLINRTIEKKIKIYLVLLAEKIEMVSSDFHLPEYSLNQSLLRDSSCFTNKMLLRLIPTVCEFPWLSLTIRL